MTLARARGLHRCGNAGSNMNVTSSLSSLGRGGVCLDVGSQVSLELASGAGAKCVP